MFNGLFFTLNRYIAEGDIYILEYKAPKGYEEYSSGQAIPVKSRVIQLFQKHKTHRKTDYFAGVFPFQSFPLVSSSY